MIYLILSAGFKDNNPDQFEKRLKIGYTKDLDSRLDSYFTSNPDCILLQTREGDTSVETYLHKKFEKYSYPKRNEWFYYNQEIIDHFQDEIEDFIDEGILLDCIRESLRFGISPISELKEKYLNQILDEIKSRDDFEEELYDEEIFTKVITDTWSWGISYFNKAIDNIELVNFQPIDLLKIDKDNPEVAVDITLDLPQILGRQRLECNPWKNRAELYIRFLSESNKITAEDFKKRQDSKVLKTKSLLSVYNKGTKEDKHNLAETYQKVARSYSYKDDYVAVNTHDGKDLIPVFNNLVMVSEFRSFEIQQIDYPDRFRIMNSLSSSGKYEFDPVMNEVENFLHLFNTTSQFQNKMKLLCEFGLSLRALNIILKQVPIEYSTYYISLGPEKMKSKSYRRWDLEKDYKKLKESKSGSIRETVILDNFVVGEKYSIKYIKEKLKQLYSENNIQSSPKAVDILDYFEVMKTRIKDDSTGKFIDAYKILSLK